MDWLEWYADKPEFVTLAERAPIETYDRYSFEPYTASPVQEELPCHQ